MGNLEVAYLTQAKGWHAPLRASTSVGTSSAHLHSKLTVGPLRPRPGRSSHDSGGVEKRLDFQGEAPTSPPDTPTVAGVVPNVGAAPAPPITKPGASADAADRNADHLAAQDAQ
ncbi:unnamed protein product [Arctia plantaginis]|uniref:Uncharacterized protein n=1 Tax=Arctia plantaginis TaxID=874455 RepID=A0A8S1AAQ3_ARCPL|nr:unnamed protein product [Arctia plantaginis]